MYLDFPPLLWPLLSNWPNIPASVSSCQSHPSSVHQTWNKQCSPCSRSGKETSKASRQMTRNKGNYIQWILSEALLGGEQAWPLSVHPLAPHLLFHPMERSGAHSPSCFPSPKPLGCEWFISYSPSLISPTLSIMHSTAGPRRLVQQCLGLGSSGKGTCHFYFHFARCHVYSQHCISNKKGLKVDFVCVLVAKWEMATSVSDFNAPTSQHSLYFHIFGERKHPILI